MASVRRGKADWYIKNGLAVCVCEDPFSFQLLYEPAGLGQNGQGYNLQKIENQCVGCSATDRLVRFCVVPHSFRSLLPHKFKAFSSHDILLVCKGCFRAASEAVARRRQQLLREHNIVDGGAGIYAVDMEMKPFRDAAKILCLGEASRRCKKWSNVPQHIVDEKLGLLRRWLGKADDEAVTEEEIKSVAGIAVKSIADDYVSAERQLFARLQLLDTPDLEARCQAFVVSWRQLFLDCVHPRYLPSGWDVNHVVGADRGD
jgi:cation-transporting P-type ATPase D